MNGGDGRTIVLNPHSETGKTVVLLSFGFIAQAMLLTLTFLFAYTLAKTRTKRKLVGLKDVLRQIADENHPNTILNPESLRKIIGTLPKWVDFSDYHRVPWLDDIMSVSYTHLTLPTKA